MVLDRWKMHFIRSEFRGLLPGRFSQESLSKVVENFNDQNKEELDKYVSVFHVFNSCTLYILYTILMFIQDCWKLTIMS